MEVESYRIYSCVWFPSLEFIREREPLLCVWKKTFVRIWSTQLWSADKSHDLVWTSWRPRRAGKVVQRTEDHWAHGTELRLHFKAWESGAPRKRRPMSQLKQLGRVNSITSHSFRLIQALHGLDEAHPHCRRQPASLSPSIKLVSFGNTITDTPKYHV